MNPINPKPSLHLLPASWQSVTYAKDQPEYVPLPSLRTEDGRVVTSWMPDANELFLLANGVPLTIVIHTFNQPLQPLMVVVGGVDLREQ